jgi:hypothetical protein
MLFVYYCLEHSGYEWDWGIEEFATKDEAEEFMAAKVREFPDAKPEDFTVIEGHKRIAKSRQFVAKFEIIEMGLP